MTPLWVTAAAVAAALVALGAALFFCWAIAEDFFAWVTGEDIDTLFGQMFGDFANVAQPFIDAWNWMERTVLAALRYWQEEPQYVPLGIYHIALEAGEPLTDTEIDDLCERLNA